MKVQKPKILIVEDDEALRLGLEENFKAAGYAVLSAGNGPEGLRLGLETAPELIILDIMLPGFSGYDVCRRLRERGKQMPIIMLTARHDEFDKLHGFELGADDYVTKPFSINELLARVRAVLARGRRIQGPAEFRFGDCVLDLRARTLMRAGKPVELTRTEFDLLAYFCQNEGRALSREVVMNDVWGTQYFGTQRSLDSFVASLRAKIEKKPSKPRHILTIHGVGYKFVK
ncbi:MAG: response regulator transcription factor [Kiritimatiellae bacterium]|nr:response regulator transcription factor [Kiritimatiellia bacterium]